MISVNRIAYNNYSSRDFDILCDLAFDSDNGDTDSYLNREAVASESYNGKIKRVHNFKYTDTLQLHFTFIKEGFGDFTIAEQRRILTWLTSKSTPSFLSVYYDDTNAVEYEVLGAFTEVTSYKLANNRTVGYVATFESVSPFAFSDLHTQTIDSRNASDKSLVIQVNTDDPESPLYPKITIVQNSVTSVVEVNHAMTDSDTWLDGTVYHYSAGNKYYWLDASGNKQTSSSNTSGIETTSVAIKNVYTDNSNTTTVANCYVKNNIKGETVVLDGANRVVSSSRANGRIFGDDFSWNWIPFAEGNNTVSVEGNCVVTIEWREPIKCGEY